MTLEFTVEVNGVDELVAKLEAIPAIWDEESRKAMILSQHLVEAEAKTLVPRVTERLASSISPGRVTKFGPELTGAVGTRVHYAPYVEYGTGLYGPKHRLIRPTTKKAMKFKIGGKTFIRRTTKGMEPRPYMAPALEASKEGVKRLFERAVENLLHRLGGRR